MQLTSTLRQRKSGVAPCSNVRSDPAVDLDDRCTTSANGTVKTAPGKGAPPAKRMTQAGGFAVAFLWFVLLNLFALWARQRTPPFLPASAPPHIFSGQRALDRVAGLCGSFRYVGTLALHQATQELAKQVQELKELAEHFSKDRFVFEYDVQRVDGSFALNIRSFHDLLIAQSYESITNIAIRIYPRELGPDARTLVVNSHYDTAAGSPGCVDATAAIGTMMEMVSGLVHAYDDETCAQDPEHMKACAERQLTHPVVFLLNGAEEVFLVGAHGFVTKHPYMDATSLLLNLEASGASGPALLFRCGPGHGWMARTYAKAVPLPHASCASQDIMNLDLFPAETDHRVFVEYGGLSGFDIASYENGYVYHTKYDNLENAGRGFIQHLGETATSLMTELVGKNAAIEMNGMSDHRAQERMVFFDIFGLFTVVYSMQFAWYLNVATCLAVLAVVTMRTKRAVKGCSPPVHLLQCFFFGIALLLACAGTGSIAGLLLRYVARRPLAWYGLENEWLMIPLFAFPACTVLLVLVDAFVGARWSWILLNSCNKSLWSFALCVVPYLRRRISAWRTFLC
ncbi:putative endoplasmic reticulum metallopeptidase 1-A [Porphyridium purpureum]|uniref:Putative endoplasmic reticulum metallopeptidase 1-A n=1 Tax=Porphyridium purpureum TaxID=35688 RepID=A0A5J4Z4S1_PORPP|nr:putative endoplasmic reticulum metallopeptidase 1-A [Porphyridium purpureum]|eukprot:POR3554..scf295_1